ncbi:unnamed protein product [Calicophoron daubneyi]|uniref:UV-stimulated scaffold protein A C-terminal domain-containing protein n=1 Tax=Calicophoron daubneyi TaxID=300641 RepID=A0AAV2TRL3_CALDB
MSVSSEQLDTTPERLKFLVDKITTAGRYKPDQQHLSELCLTCCRSSEKIKELFHLLLVQLRQRHAQVRLGVLHLLANMASPSFIWGRVSSSGISEEDVRICCKTIRDLVLLNLQNITALTLRTDPDMPPLPPPPEFGDQIQQQLLEILLDWELGLKEGKFLITSPTSSDRPATESDNSPPTIRALCWSPLKQAQGQLKSFLIFLRSGSHRTTLKSQSPNIELAHVQSLLRNMEETRARRQQRMRDSRLARNTRIIRQVRRCLMEINNSGNTIADNLTALSSVLEMLVPNPLSDLPSTSSSPPLDMKPTTDHLEKFERDIKDCSPEALREHGYLLGTSSGLGLSCSKNIEIRLPGTSAGEPCVQVENNEDTRLLWDSASEYAKLARDKHKPTLLKWSEELMAIDTADADDTLRSRSMEKLEYVHSLLGRLNKLTHQFFDRIIFTDTSVAAQKESADVASSTDSSDASDLEEVGPSPSSAGQKGDDSGLTEHETRPEVELPSTSHTDSFGIGQAVPEVECASDTTKSDNNSPEYVDPSQLSTSMPCAPVLPTKSTVVWRANESLHRFWRPVDPEEYQVPSEYIECAISSTSFMREYPNEQKTTTTDFVSAPEQIMSSPAPVATETCPRVNTLACWAPLVSGQLCPRRDPGGRCPIHGRIVKRDQVTGIPINPADRELLRAEAVRVQQAKVEKKKKEMKSRARRRYPGLQTINKKENTSRSRLKMRVLGKNNSRIH